jgi:hypothetical protein
MSYHDKLIAEINAKLDELATEKTAWRAQWIAQAICSEHSTGLAGTPDADFWRHCGYVECRDEVRRCINRRAGDDKPASDDRQLHLPGYERLQLYYVVTRDGDDVGVPVEELTDQELEAKAATYRSMGAACYRHADEIDRFKRLRRVAA